MFFEGAEDLTLIASERMAVRMAMPLVASELVAHQRQDTSKPRPFEKRKGRPPALAAGHTIQEAVTAANQYLKANPTGLYFTGYTQAWLVVGDPSAKLKP